MLFLFCVTPGVASGRYDLGIKDVATAAGVVELTYPACSAPVYLSRQSYAAGRQVSHDRMCDHSDQLGVSAERMQCKFGTTQADLPRRAGQCSARVGRGSAGERIFGT